jgi:chemotaxis protein CheD
MTERIAVRVAEIIVQAGPVELVALGLGSCVAIVLHDPEVPIGGMAHILLPAPPPRRPPGHIGRYAQSAVPALVDRMVEAGALRHRLTARLVGGSSMFAGLLAPGAIHVGERNIVAAHAALHAQGVRVAGEWVGGDFGRSVFFDTGTGALRVTSVGHGTRLL